MDFAVWHKTLCLFCGRWFLDSQSAPAEEGMRVGSCKAVECSMELWAPFPGALSSRMDEKLNLAKQAYLLQIME